MLRSKTLISQALSTLVGNIERTGDPLGMKSEYWTEWAKGIDLPRNGKTIILTGRMYQMAPYITEVGNLMGLAKPLLERNVLGDVARLGSRVMGERILRWKVGKENDLKVATNRALSGIAKTLLAIGIRPAYLYEDEPYSGALLYDLGLDKYLPEYINKVYKLMKERGVKEVIGVDPHTVFMLREVYPKFIDKYDLEVNHYSRVLVENIDKLKGVLKKRVEKKLVIHDACFMARNLGLIEEPRNLLQTLGVTVLEPENKKLDTLCCGGPVEYAFPEMNEGILKMRMEELGQVSKNIVVSCPICFLNLKKHEPEDGAIFDLGELLYQGVTDGGA